MRREGGGAGSPVNVPGLVQRLLAPPGPGAEARVRLLP